MSFFIILFFRWLNLLSLDVVFIALAWQEAFARTAAVTLHWEERLLLATAVWMVYIIDHWLDGTVYASDSNNAPRHHYVKTHRFLLSGGLLCALGLVFLLLLHLSWNLILAGILLACITTTYLVINHFFLRSGFWLKGREIIISLIFSIGCALAPLVQSHRSWLLLPWIMAFSIVAWSNCTLIARMERKVSAAGLAPKWMFSLHWVIGLCCLLLFCSFFVPIIGRALCWSFIGLAFIPMTTKYIDYEVASLATDQVLFFGALLALLR